MRASVTEICISIKNNSQRWYPRSTFRGTPQQTSTRVDQNAGTRVSVLQYSTLYLDVNKVRGQCFQRPHFPCRVPSHLQLGSEPYFPGTPASPGNNHPPSIITIFSMLSTSSVKAPPRCPAQQSCRADRWFPASQPTRPDPVKLAFGSLLNDLLCPSSIFPKSRQQVARWLRRELNTSLSAIQTLYNHPAFRDPKYDQTR